MTKNTETQPSEFLKDCMAEAVIKLLERQPLEKIQVKQICDASGYHRASWFRAFHSKNEAVTYHMIRLWEQWSERHGIAIQDDFVIDNAEAFFQYNYEIRETTSLLYRRGLMTELAASFTSVLIDRHANDPIRAYQSAIFAFALFGILREWIIRNFDQSPSDMARILRSATACMV